MSSQNNLGVDDSDVLSHVKRRQKKPRQTSTNQKDPKHLEASKSKKGASTSKVASPYGSEIVSQGKTQPSVSKLSNLSLETPPIVSSRFKKPASYVKTPEVSKSDLQCSEVHKEVSAASDVSKGTVIVQHALDDKKVAFSEHKAASELKYSAILEEPKRLFPDSSYLPPEEAVAAIRAGHRPSTWVPRRDDSDYSTHGAALMSAINRMTKDKGKEEDELASASQDGSKPRSPGTNVAQVPSKFDKAKQRKSIDYRAHGNLWTALSKLQARYSQRCASPSINLTLTTREKFILCTLAIVIAMLPVVIIATTVLKRGPIISSAISCSGPQCSDNTTSASHHTAYGQ